MRLFAAGTFYLHQSSSVAAEWLCDRDTISQLRNTGNLLSSVIQMHTMDIDTRLFPLDTSVHIECEDTCDWLHASAFNMVWMLDYFETLDRKCNKLFKHAPITHEFKRTLRSYVDMFDETDTTADWLLAPSIARTMYAKDVKQYQYRRVKAPFWLSNTKASNTPSDVTDSYGLPSSLLDLELDLSDLAPLD
jgi:hypothetical protein